MLRTALKGMNYDKVHAIKNSEGPWSYATAPIIKDMAREDFKFTKKYEPKSKAKRTDKMKYRLHVVHDLGGHSEEWTVLSCYRHLSSVYKRINKSRKHSLEQRMHRPHLRRPTFFIEFLNAPKGDRMVRAFDLTPQALLNSDWIFTQGKTVEAMSNPHFYPAKYVLMPSAKSKFQQKKKTHH